MSKNQYSDNELLELFKNENSRNFGFNLLINKYQQRVYWLIRRMVIDHNDAEDVTQNTFLKVWQGLDNFRNESALFSWIYRIATNEALNFLKHKRFKFFIPIENVSEQLSQTIENDELFDGDEIEKKLQKAILTLPDKQRLVFNMKYYDDLKYEEISEIIGTSVGALKASYHHAVKKIENFMQII